MKSYITFTNFTKNLFYLIIEIGGIILKKIVPIFLVVLLFFQSGLPAVGVSVKADSDSFDITVEPNANSEQAVINISALDESMTSLEVLFPKGSEFNEQMTRKHILDAIELTYDEVNHKVTLNRLDDQTLLSARIILTNLTETDNVLSVQGNVKGEMTNLEDYKFSIPQDTPKSDEADQQVEEQTEKEQTEEEETVKEGTSESNSNNQKNSKNEEPVNDELKEETAAMPTERSITPFSGDLNVDIDLSPQKSTVLSGNAAGYNLVLKVTGSRTEYTNAKIVIDLPIMEYTSFTQNLSELVIDGVTPVYNESTHQLIYEFDSIKTGRSYESLIKVNTENGISPHGAELTAQASFESDNQEKITDDATVTINASNAVNVSKRFLRVVGTHQVPSPNAATVWEIKIDIPKKDIGQMYLKEGTVITVTDTLPDGLSYVNTLKGHPPSQSQGGKQLTWTFPVPSMEEQENSDELFSTTIEVQLRVNAGTANTTQTNRATANATFIDEQEVSKSAEDGIRIFTSEQANGTIQGSVYVPGHYGPSNGNGGIGNNDLKDPNPIVYDDALLQFRHTINSMQEGRENDFREYNAVYNIDPNLILKEIRTPGSWQYRPTSGFPAGIPLKRNPEFNIHATVNGTEVLLITEAQSGTTYTRGDLGLTDSDHISRIRYEFTYAPAGMYGLQASYYFHVKPGYEGPVENWVNIYGRDFNNVLFNKQLQNQSGSTDLAGPRHATIASKPTDQPPIGQVAIELLDHDGGEVIRGDNRMKVTLTNSSSSTVTMSGPLETVVLLPIGVTLSPNPDATYTDTDGTVSEGNYEILSDNYNGAGRQLVKIKWNDERNRIGRNVATELDVIISDGAPNSLQFDVYGFSGEKELRVPETSGNNITDTTLQTDEDDLNGDEITDQPRLKSGNIYLIRGTYDIQTEKLVKGELDDNFTYFGHTIPGGSIDYQVKLTNTTGRDITKMTLIDVLPSVGDLGITDNIDRGSQFTPNLTNSIVLPTEWHDKVNIYYSTTKNPNRDDLTRNTKYPDSTIQLTNPAGAEAPNWMTESQVTDWSTIHSFKIELKEGVEWIKGQDMMIQFSMQAPSEFEVERDVLDASIDPTARAAWNSFAVATDHGQPVEPLRVGVYMDYEIEDPEVEKTVNDSKDSVELIDQEEVFTWKVEYDFGNYTGNWESVEFSDQIHELLDIESVQVIDQDGQDVAGNGELEITDNLVKFTLNKQSDSFAYLKDQIYTLIIESKIKSTVTDEELEPFIQSGGIPNQAELIINDDPQPSNEVKVKPPVYGDVRIIKVDEDTREILQDAEFELRKCPAEESRLVDCKVIASGTSDASGELAFNRLEKGHYKLIETKAPEGYRLLTKPIDLKITDTERDIQLEVENKKSGWELPNTGGIGTFIFYLIGGLLMASALLYLLKRKKVSE